MKIVKSLINRARPVGLTIVAVIIGAYLLSNLILALTEHRFIGTVQPLAIKNAENDIVSIARQGELKAKGYKIRNIIAPPFYWHAGSYRIREGLIVGETYCFTSLGQRRRFPRNRPTIIRFEAPENCPSADGASN